MDPNTLSDRQKPVGTDRERTTANTSSAVTFKTASEDWEFREIHRLNYETFVEEIPQHPSNPDRVLVDQFHHENTYLIAVRDRRLLGMMALRDRRPFSLDRKLPDLDQFLPAGRRPCEIRLLAARGEGRNGLVFRGLANLLFRHTLGHGYDLLVISGTPRQASLYRGMGFVPFGPLVGTGEAAYQPMYLTIEAFRQQRRAYRALAEAPGHRTAEPLNFLPGPVAARPGVRAALQQPAVSHRSPAFVNDFQSTRRGLCRLASANHVDIMMGSGTLANDAVAAEMALWSTAGLVLTNGAFGERLVDHAARFGLSFQALQADWGRPFERSAIEKRLDDDPSLRWLWAVHGETSTGVLNDLTMLKEVTAARGMRLAVDAVSSLGVAPVDLRGVAVASGVSGKGLGACPGLAFVFREDAARPASPSLPRYLDLGLYTERGGIPFTVSSNLLYALKAALEGVEGDGHFARVAELAARLREGLRVRNLETVAQAAVFPPVTTIALPAGCDSTRAGRRLEDAGYLLHYRSDYLVERNWIQVCLMGECTAAMIDELLNALAQLLE